MEKDFLKNLSFESQNLVSALLFDKKSKEYSINWGKNVFSKNPYFLNRLLYKIKTNYPKNIENNTKISVSSFDIRKCGDIPCIYKSFLENKDKIKLIIQSYNVKLSNELEEILEKGDDGLLAFQEFVNKIRNLEILQEMTIAINTKNNSEMDDSFFSDLFIPSEIQYEMEKYKKLWIIEGNYNNIRVQIISNNKKHEELIYQSIARMETMRKMMNWNNKLELILLDSKKKRKYRSDNIGRREVNGGYTWRGSGKIHIFRKQECKKVLLHELIHTFDIDYKHEQDMCESHAELWATIMNCIFTIIESNNRISINLLGALLSFESAFSKIQERKVSSMIEKDKTSTLAKGYYIYKSLLLENLDKYLEMIGVGNPIFSFPVENNEKFKLFIKILIQNNQNNVNIPSKLRKTLRMTCIEV
jgi:hypothetical protein